MPRNTKSAQLVRRRSPRNSARPERPAPPAPVRANSRLQAIQEGNQFLSAFNFDPSTRRNVIAPTRFTLDAKKPRLRRNRAVAAAPAGPGAVRSIKKHQIQQSKGKSRASAAAVVNQPPQNHRQPIVVQIAPSTAFNRGSVSGGSSHVNPLDISEIHAVWRFKSDVPAFALHVTPTSVLFGDQAGRVSVFDLEGTPQKQVQLPAGVKSLVSDTHWVYAGCDNGAVYDLTNPDHPRVAYLLPNTNTNTTDVEMDGPADEDTVMLMDVDSAAPEAPNSAAVPAIRQKHVVFVVDISGSMRGALIQSAISNVRSMIENQLGDDDLISLVKFNDQISTLFSNFKKRDQFDRISTAIGLLSAVSGSTALWDGFQAGIQSVRSASQANNNNTLDSWVVVLTDGQDNVSKIATVAGLQEQVVAANCHVIAISIGNNTNGGSLEQICRSATQNGKQSKHIAVGSSARGVDEAFKIVAQLLNARVTSLAIADGLVSISDADGCLTVCNIDGVRIWSHKAEHTGGWMVRADARSVYHGHDGGVSRYNLRNGAVEDQQLLGSSVFYGCQTPDTLFVAAGSCIHRLSKAGNNFGGANAIASVAPAVIISNAAGMLNGKVALFAADSAGVISCFQWDPAQPNEQLTEPVWRLSCNSLGTPLSMQAVGDRLYIATTKGFLACLDISSDATAGGRVVAQCRDVKVDNMADATVPIHQIPITNNAGNGIVVQCVRELSDDDLLQVHRAIHDLTAASVVVRGKSYPIEMAPTKRLRFVSIAGMRFMEQNPKKTGKYAQMARSGHRITWCLNGASPRWGLIVDDRVESNTTSLKMRVVSDGFNKNWDVQFPVIDNSQRQVGARFVVDQILPADNGQYYRALGNIAKLA